MSKKSGDYKKAFQKVFEFFTTEPIGYFAGRFDALHANLDFICGVCSVMEVIADMAGKLEEFDEIWSKNVAKSEEKAAQIQIAKEKEAKIRSSKEAFSEVSDFLTTNVFKCLSEQFLETGGSTFFMYGVYSVMELIADKAGEKEEFNKRWHGDGMTASYERTER